jgi:hypothetical protein
MNDDNLTLDRIARHAALAAMQTYLAEPKIDIKISYQSDDVRDRAMLDIDYIVGQNHLVGQDIISEDHDDKPKEGVKNLLRSYLKRQEGIWDALGSF